MKPDLTYYPWKHLLYFPNKTVSHFPIPSQKQKKFTPTLYFGTDDDQA